MKTFPDGFLWGAATASYQVEGGIENTDWAEAARQGRVPVCGRACDHYHLFETDFDLVKSLGHNTHKISIEWARIEPEEGKFSDAEIEHYAKVIDALHARGIRPIVMLWHFTLPLWFSKKGGFTSVSAPETFARYAEYVIDRLGHKAEMWMTINEPLIYASAGYFKGTWPPFKKNPLTYIKVQNILIRAHNAAARVMKKKRPNIKIGIAKNNIYFHADSNPWNRFHANWLNWYWNRRFLNGIDAHHDFIGLNYYFHKKFGAGKSERYEKTEMNWDIYPDGLYHVILELKRYNKPVYIIENGLADAKDTQRTLFLRGHLDAVHRAIEQGVDVRGYLHWSLLDNYEWSFGFAKRFGLIEVNYDTLERKIRPSALVFKEICEKNSL